MSLIDNDFFKFGDCELDAGRRLLRCAGEPVPLGAKTFDLLLHLVRHADRVATKEELLSALWPRSVVEESNLSQQVFLLRKALAGDRAAGSLIVTVPGRGYRLGVPVEALATAPPPGAPAAAPVPAPADAAAAPPQTVFVRSVQTSTTVVVEEGSERTSWRERLAAWPRWARRASLAGLAVLAVGGATLAADRWWERPRPVLRRVVLAQFRNRTGEPVFDNSLMTGLRIDLEQTPYVVLLGSSDIAARLAEMEKPADTALTAEVAREVCRRANFDVVLDGEIERVGSRYRLMLEAVRCAGGEVVVGAKKDVPDEGDVLAATDDLTRTVRRALGESRTEIDRYSVPLYQATTSSIEALEYYTQASAAFLKGDDKACQDLVEHALKIDPNFALAWVGLASLHYNRGDFRYAATLYRRAYDLRLSTGGYERLSIETFYYGNGLRDYEHAVQAMRAVLEMHPEKSNIWGNLCNIYTQMGQYPQAIEAGERALQLNPTSRSGTAQLATAYLKANRFADAKRVLAPDLASGKAGFGGHSTALQLAWLEHDLARSQAMTQWALDHSYEARGREDLGLSEAAEGRLTRALADLEFGHERAVRDKEAEIAGNLVIDEVETLARLGEPAQALRRLGQADPDLDTLQRADAAAEAGDAGPGRRYLASADAADNHSTPHDFMHVPTLRARIALLDGHPEAALAALEPARPYQLHGLDVPALRAQAEAAAGLWEAAEADYRLVIANPGAETLSLQRPLAHLGLARVLVQEKQPAAARAEYAEFLSEMKAADPGLPVVARARTEMAAI